MAAGVKVNNEVISRRLPGNGEDLETILEYAKARGKSTGIVTTTAVTHATPAAFTAHNESRNNYAEIAWDLFTVTKPDVVLGGGGSVYGVDLALVSASGYNLVTTGIDLLSAAEESPLCSILCYQG
jgi:alkaline phosphatase